MLDMSKLQSMISGMQEHLQELESKAQAEIITRTSGGGLVSISINGAGEVLDIRIDDTLLDDKEALQILLISALNDAYKSIEEAKKTHALSLLGGLQGGINPFNKS